MNKFLKYFLVIVLVVFFILVFMAIFRICPPKGPWIMPPWCNLSQSHLKESIDFNTKDLNLKKDTKSIFYFKVFVIVPYKTKEVYFVSDNNKIKLEKLDEIIFTGNVSTDSNYFYLVDGKKSKFFYPKAKIKYDAVYWDKKFPENYHKGVTFGAMHWTETDKKYIDYSLDLLKEFNVNSIILIPDWFVVPDYTGTEIKPIYTKPNSSGWISPTLTDEELIGIIRKAKARNLRVVLKPHVDPVDFGINPNSSRGSLSPKDWNVWFDNYKSFILHYASIAQKEKVDLFVIGTELDTAVRNHNKEWLDIIEKVRNVYSGPITYSVSCHGECFSPAQVTFWDKLDYIGFEPYFGLTDKNDPTIEEMKIAFSQKLDKYAKPLYKKYKKPVLLTETNIYSYDGANKHPIDPPNNAKPDLIEQAEYYEAVFQAIKTKDWIKGIYWWGWMIDSTLESSIDASLKDRYDPFVWKPAGQVMKKWYS